MELGRSMGMIELPGSLREFFILQIEDELAPAEGQPKSWSAAIIIGLDALAEEIDQEVGENIVAKLEESGELEGKLGELLPDAFAHLEGSDATADDLVGVLDKLCEIAWINEDGDDEIARGFMDGSDGYEDEEY
jgi:hypothetical protein